MHDYLQGCSIAVLIADGFEQSEMEDPVFALRCVGAQVHLVSPENHKVRSHFHGRCCGSYEVDVALAEADAGAYDALLIPGGAPSVRRLQTFPRCRQFVRRFWEDGKPIAAVSHAPQLLVWAGVVKGCRVTSARGVRDTMEKAGALWVDEPAVAEWGLVTGRDTEDLPYFIEQLAESCTTQARGVALAG